MKLSRKVVHTELFVEGPEWPKLMADWSSCVRFAYNRFRKGSDFNGVRVAAKTKYPRLSTRQISDAVTEARGRHERTKDSEPMVFGGKKLFAKVCSGEVSAEQWRFVRDGMMYARGDKSKSGNPTLRVIRDDNGYRLRVVVGNRHFRFYRLSVPYKFKEAIDQLLPSGMAYNVRWRRKSENTHRVIIDYEVDAPQPTATFKNGCLGVDTNPDRMAICLVSADGNRLSSHTFINTRMFYGSKTKTDCEIGCLVQQITDIALAHGVGIAAENLKFKPKFVNGWRKSNRMKSRFVWRKFLTLLERKCVEKGIEFRKVNPAFTSVQGRLKYQRMFSIPIHEAAAYVIGRRASGLPETLSVYQLPHGEARRLVLQTLQEAGNKLNRHYHSWSLWKQLANTPVLTERQPCLSSPGELDGSASDGWSGGGNPSGESRAITGRPRHHSIHQTFAAGMQRAVMQAEERQPLQLAM